MALWLLPEVSVKTGPVSSSILRESWIRALVVIMIVAVYA